MRENVDDALAVNSLVFKIGAFPTFFAKTLTGTDTVSACQEHQVLEK